MVQSALGEECALWGLSVLVQSASLAWRVVRWQIGASIFGVLLFGLSVAGDRACGDLFCWCRLGEPDVGFGLANGEVEPVRCHAITKKGWRPESPP